MGDEMDECTCFWSNELIMRRLLAFLRRGQEYCTDTECIDLPLAGRSASTDDGNNFTMMSIFVILAVILYIFRPNSLRRRENTEEKRLPSNDQGPNDEGSPPPATN